jgi:hypothetical protein
MFYAERAPAPTRALSPRQLPTDHGHAVPTREYQSDQSSRQLLRCHRLGCPNNNRSRLTSRNVFPLRRPSNLWVNARTVLDGKGPLRRAKNRRTLAVCAPFRPTGTCDGRLRREHFRVGLEKGKAASPPCGGEPA